MRLLLDLQTLQSQSRDRGIGRYSLGLAQAIADEASGLDIVALQNAAMPLAVAPDGSMLGGRLSSEKVSVFPGLPGSAGLAPRGVQRAAASDLIRDAHVGRTLPDIVHIASPFDGFGDDTVVGAVRSVGHYLSVATAYDLIPLDDPERHLPTARHRAWFENRLERLKSVDLVLAISQQTRMRVIEALGVEPKRVVTIMGDADPDFRRLDLSAEQSQEVLRRYGICKPFIMHTGILEPRKNIPALIRAFAHLDRDLQMSYQIVLAARSTEVERERLRQLAKMAGLDPTTIVFAGHVPDRDLVILYNLCAVFAFPSLAEGLGLPPLEAMRCNCLPIGSRHTSTAEIIGDDDLLFDPTDDRSIAVVLRRALRDQDFRRSKLASCEIQQKQFSWASSARLALDAMIGAARALERAHVSRARYRIVHHLGLGPMDQHLEEESSSGLIDENRAASKGVPAYIVGQNGLNPEIVAAVGRDPGVVLLPDRPSAPLVTASHSPRTLVYQAYGYRGLLARSHVSSELAWALTPGVVAAMPKASFEADIVPQLRAAVAVATLREAATLARRSDMDEATLKDLSNGLSAVVLEPVNRRLFVDVTELAQRDARSGVQRVVRNIVQHLLRSCEDWRVEPIYADGPTFRYARRFTLGLLEQSPLDIEDEAVDFQPGDTFLGLDLNVLMHGAALDTLQYQRRRGLIVWFVVYDLLPLLMPDCFDPALRLPFHRWISGISEIADGLLAISRSVADEIVDYLDGVRPRRRTPLLVTHFNLGGDLDLDGQGRLAVAEHPRPEDEVVIKALAGRTFFLKVGTIEPRKGHLQLLEAFEHLWQQGHDLTLVLVGKAGWLTKEAIRRIERHAERGKRLFWLANASDAVLERLYESATAVVQASYGEGYGLPLIEAARHHAPIIARDIPVFRELADGYATFFRGETARDIAETIAAWIGASPATRRRSDQLPWISWSQSTAELLQAIDGKKPYRAWQAGPRWIRTPAHPDMRTGTGTLSLGRLRVDAGEGVLLEMDFDRVDEGRYLLEVMLKSLPESAALLRARWFRYAQDKAHPPEVWEVSVASPENSDDPLCLLRRTVEIDSVADSARLVIEHVAPGLVDLHSVSLTRITQLCVDP